MGFKDIKRIVRKYYAVVYANTFDNLDETDKILESTNYKTF